VEQPQPENILLNKYTNLANQKIANNFGGGALTPKTLSSYGLGTAIHYFTVSTVSTPAAQVIHLPYVPQ